MSGRAMALAASQGIARSEAPPAKVRIAANRLADRHLLAMFQLGRHFLEETHLRAGEQQLDPAMVLIDVTVGIGSVERSMREKAGRRHDPAQRGEAPTVRPMSRRAVAVATGLPRETVRRRVKKLVDMGVLEEGPSGIVTADPGCTEQRLERLVRMLAQQVALTNVLIAEGILELEHQPG